MRRVCVFTGSRADYGPLSPVIDTLDKEADVELQLLVTGGHLVRDQGLTVEHIEADGFRVDETVEMVIGSDTPRGAIKSFGVGAIGYADALQRLSPDIVLVLGDRYEALAFVVCASFFITPIAHIGGGEMTTGSLDDSVRHSITKFAHLHFTGTDEARQRVLQLGENPQHVHNTGAPGLDTVLGVKLLSRAELEARLGIDLCRPTVLVTYHPATADPVGSRAGIDGLLTAIDRMPELTAVFTQSNVDLGGREISDSINRYVSHNADRAVIAASLGQQYYLSLVSHSDAVVGNSSSGIAEAPALHTPTVNIGSRQTGRPRATSVVDCREDAVDIERAIRKALTPEHRTLAESAISPYGDGRASRRIVDIMKDVDYTDVMNKSFHSYQKFARRE